MISSGESVLEVASALKKRKANRIFVFATFGLFTAGLDRFDKAYAEGVIDRVLTTNLIYQTPELLGREWYISCDMSKYIAYIIDTLNHDTSITVSCRGIGCVIVSKAKEPLPVGNGSFISRFLP